MKNIKTITIFTTLIVGVVIQSGVIVNTNSANKELLREIITNNKKYDSLSNKLDAVNKLEKTNADKNNNLEKYINDNKKIFESAASMKKTDDDIKTQNQDLIKQNEILKAYRASKEVSRGATVTNKLKINKITVEVSMYGATGKKTASGCYPKWGMIAAPLEIPMGTSMIIDGYFENKVFTVADTGGYIKKVGNVYRIDVFTPYGENYSNTFGRKYNVTAYIISEE